MATCRSCSRSTVFLLPEHREDGRCASCRMGVDPNDTRWHPHFGGKTE